MFRIIIPKISISPNAQIKHKKTDIAKTMSAQKTQSKVFPATRKQGAKLFASSDEFPEQYFPKNI